MSKVTQFVEILLAIEPKSLDFQSLVIYNTLMKQTTAIVTTIRSEQEWDCHWGLCR